MLAFAPGPARAEPKPTSLGWWPWHYWNLDFSKRYLEDGKTPHPSQWEFDAWTPDTWTNDRANEDAVIQGFYDTNILSRQYVDKGLIPILHKGEGIPVLEVGQNFLRLSDKDKRRVVAYVDSVWGITAKEGGMFYVNYKEWNKPIGIYTKNGLQMQ